MGSSLKKITINELEIGMFISELDISWMKSPFLFHRRAIKSEKDILLLRKSGVKFITIDLERQKTSSKEKIIEEKKHQAIANAGTTEVPDRKISKPEISVNSLDNPVTFLKEELERAIILKEQANEAFKEISDLVNKNEAIKAEILEPVIDETIYSLCRNSQALLTLLHLKRYEGKVFGHSFSVMTLALTFAIKQGVSEKDIKILGMAALLHDVGWAQLPLSLFGKAKKYTDNEIKVVHQHQKIANIIVAKSDTISNRVKNIMMEHHERMDGSGYPEGLKEKQIDSLAKILILVDYYDEVVHGLLDQPGLIPSEALRLLYKDAVEKKLDKLQVEMLIKLMGIYPLTSAIELSSGEKGIVIEVNREKPLVPVVKVMYSAEGFVLGKPLLVNLENDEKHRHIKGIVDFSDAKSDPQNLLTVAEV